MIIADFHVHTNFSGDSSTPMKDMIGTAIKMGLKHICVTDHMDYLYPEQYNMNFTFQVDKYFRELEEMTTQYQDQIKIYKGIELGLMPNLARDYKELVRSYPFDFVIGSSHLVNNLDPYYSEFWEGIDEEAGYRKYFQTILDNLDSFDDFDTYGHLDYIVRYGPNKNLNYTYEKYADILDKILLRLINNNKALEVNTSGFKYGLAQTHPHGDVIKRYKELGGDSITIGSDAHKSEHLAYDFQKAREILILLGFKYYTIFEKRNPEFLKL